MGVPTTISVSTETELNAAITALDQSAAPGAYTIKIAGDITEGDPSQPAGIVAIDLASGVSLTIEGDDHVLNGANANGGLAVLNGKVTIANLTIEDTVAQGGAGDSSSGGGAGMGGGLFVGPGGDVVISNLQFVNDTAVGGAGGPGGGGGGGGNSSLIYAPLGAKGSTGAVGADGDDATTPFTYGGAGSLGSPGGAGGYGMDAGGGGDGGKGGKGAAGTVSSNYTGGYGGPGGAGATGGTGGPGGKGGDGGGGGDGGDGGDGTMPPSNWPKYAGAPVNGARGGTGAKGGVGGYGGGGGAGGDGGGGGKGGGAPPANTAVAGKTGATGGVGGAAGSGAAGGFGAGGGGGGKGGDGGDGGDGGMGGKGGKTQAKTGGKGHVGGAQPAPSLGFAVGGSYAPGNGGNGGAGAAGGAGGHGGVGGFGGGGGGGGLGGNGGAGGAGGAGGTPGSSSYPAGMAGADGNAGASGAGGIGAGGGFGGGAGAGAGGGLQGAGGGGLGAGGDIFVAGGGVLVVEGGSMSGGVTGGAAGGSGATDGLGYGGAIFLQGDEDITLAASTVGPAASPAATNLNVYNDITDEKAHGGTGSGGVVISGAGVVTLWSSSDYTGGTQIESGDLVLNAANALGSGVVDFTNKAGATLTFNRTDVNSTLPGTPSNVIEGFAVGDQMIIYGIAATSKDYSNGLLTLTGLNQGVTVSVTLHLSGAYASSDFSLTPSTYPDGTGATTLRVDTPPPGTTFTYLGGADDFATAAAWLDNFGNTAVPGTAATALFPDGGTLTGTGAVAVIDVTSNTTFSGAFTTRRLDVANASLTLSSGSLTTRQAKLGGDALTAGDLNLTGAGNLFSATGNMVDGGAGAGSIEIVPGASAHIGGGLTLGADGGSGALTVTGDGDNSLTGSLTVSSALVIGGAASTVTSQVTLNNQATLSSGSVTIGQAAGSKGAATLNFGLSAKNLAGYAPTWTVTGHLVVGAYGDGALTENGSGPVQIYPTVNVSGYIDVGQFAGSTGVITMTTANLYGQHDLIVGDKGEGTLNGGYVAVKGNIDIGKNVGGVGHAYFDGGGLQTSGGALAVGRYGQGTLSLSNNANGRAVLFNVGVGASGAGVVNLDHAQFDATTLIVGDQGTGSVTVADSSNLRAGGVVGGVHIVVGRNNVGTLSIASQGKVTTTSSVDIGRFAAGNGAIDIDGAGSRLDAASNFPSLPILTGALIDGDAGIGDLKITNSGVADFAGFNLLGAQKGATGTLEVQSGGAANFGVFLNLGFALGATGKATVTGAGSALTVTGAVNIGDGGSGELDVLAGGKASVVNYAGGVNYVALGGYAGASGVVLIDGLGTSFTSASDISVGVGGAGKLTVSDSAVLNAAGSLFAGAVAGVQTSIDVESGGKLMVASALTFTPALGGKTTLTVGSATVSAASLAVGSAGGGVASVTIGAGGVVTVGGAEVFAGDTISLTGGQLLANPLTIDSGGVVSGYGTIAGAVTNLGGVTASGGLLDIAGNIGGALKINQGAALKLEQVVATGAAIQFGAGGGETLTLGDSADFAASQISGFVAGDAIDIAGFSYSGPATVTLGPTDVLTLAKDGGGQIDLAFTSNEVGAQFSMVGDGAGGVIVTDNVPCYMAGTLILTSHGEVAVERLKVGDRVRLAAGGERPIVWLGRRILDVSRHPDPVAVRPVRVQAGAFAEGQPRRDLWLSPGHNVASEGALMPISCLTNGRSVAQIAVDQVEYWHVELDAHDVILAEGLPAESYLDTGNRTAFVNGGAFVEAHPDFRPRHWAQTCLPLALEGPAVVATRARLLARLAGRGCEVTQEADAYVEIDGLKVAPIRLSDTRLAFALPSGGREIVLRSPTFIPAHTTLESRDPRRLGLCVGALQIDGSPVALDISCASGWHEAETVGERFTHRWTDGSTPLPPGARIVIIDLAGAGRYWRDDAIALSA